MGDKRPFIRLLRVQYKFIKEELHPGDKLIDVLYQESYISRNHRENILRLAKADPSRAIDVFIKGLVHSLKCLNDNQYDKRENQLLEIFREYKSEYLLNINGENHDCETTNHTAEGLARSELSSSDLRRLLQSEHTNKLLTDELEPKRIIDELLVYGAISFDDHEDIFIKAWRVDRVEILLNYITRNPDKTGLLFLESLRTVDPLLEQKLYQSLSDISNEDVRDISISLQHKQHESIKIKVPRLSNVDITLRLRFNGNGRELDSVERDIVSTSVNPDFQVEVMDCETSIEGVSFSSVVIHLKAHSDRALPLIYKLLQKPEEFKQWLDKLLTTQQKQQLLNEGWDTISVEVKAEPRSSFTDCTSILNKTLMEVELEYLLTQKLRGLREFLKQLDGLILSDKQIEIIQNLEALQNDDELANGVVRLLPTLPQSCICRFEMFLKMSGQHYILRYVKQQSDLLDLGEVTKSEIRENMTYLCQEIYPEQFYHILPDSKLKQLPIQGSRRERCEVFLRYILGSDDCDLYIRKFVDALDSLKMYNVLQMLFSSKGANNPKRALIYGERLKKKLLENRVLIMNEVDVVMLRAPFLDRGILTEKQFNDITSQPSRKARIVKLMNEILDAGYPALVCFVDALKISGYKFVAGIIENTPDQVLPCPCFAEKADSSTLLETTFSVQLTVCEDGKSTGDSALDTDDFTSSGQPTEDDDLTLKPSSSDTPLDNTYKDSRVHLLSGDSIKSNTGTLDTCEYIEEWLEKCSEAVIHYNASEVDTVEVELKPVEMCHLKTSISKTCSTGVFKQASEQGKDTKRKRNVKERSYRNKGYIVFEYLNLGFTPRTLLSVRDSVRQNITAKGIGWIMFRG